eukprot:849301-Rhodomonas_salina.1
MAPRYKLAVRHQLLPTCADCVPGGLAVRACSTTDENNVQVGGDVRREGGTQGFVTSPFFL